jgi:hypothetical protein
MAEFIKRTNFLPDHAAKETTPTADVPPTSTALIRLYLQSLIDKVTVL